MRRRFPNNGREPNELCESLLMDRVEVATDGSDCWLWFGYRTSLGYGRVLSHRKSYLTHRLAMHLFRDFDLSSKLCVLHRCDNPPCCNPDHLFVGTVLDNTRDMWRKGRGPKHPTGENAYTAKLTHASVLKIFKLLDEGMEQKKIAAMFNISRCHVTELKQGLYWDKAREEYNATK